MTECYWQKNTKTDKWNRIENPETDPHKNSMLIVSKRTMTIQWTENSLSTNGTGTVGCLYLKKRIYIQTLCLSQKLTQSDSKCITDLNVKCKLKKTSIKNLGKYLGDYLGLPIILYSHVNSLTCVLSHFSCVWLCATLWTVACQAPLSMEFSRQEYRSGLPFPSPGDLPDPGIEPVSLASPTLIGGFLPLAPEFFRNNIKKCDPLNKQNW